MSEAAPNLALVDAELRWALMREFWLLGWSLERAEIAYPLARAWILDQVKAGREATSSATVGAQVLFPEWLDLMQKIGMGAPL